MYSGLRGDNIIDGINIDDLIIEQYLRLTQENHTPSMVKKVDDMTIAEYIEYEERIKRQYSRNFGSYFLTYSVIAHPTITQPLNFLDMELDEEAGYTTDEESVMTEHKVIDPAHAVKLSSEEDHDEWLKVEMEKHTSKQNEKNKEDALTAIIKSIREECRAVHKNKQISASEADLKKSSEAMEDTINNDSFTSNLPYQPLMRNFF
ncbi:hypothetical protein Tco_1253026 [Tanacetum coccineum]